MARSRIAVMGASCWLVLAAAPGVANAQTAGSPLPLLQIDHAKAAVHGRHETARIARANSAHNKSADHKSADRTTVHRHVAKHIAKRAHAGTRVADAGRDLPAPPATSPQPTPPHTAPQKDAPNIWSAPSPAVMGSVDAPSGSAFPGGAAAAAPAATVVTEPVVDTDPNGILNGGHIVPAATPAPVTPAASTPSPKPQPAAARPAAAPASSAVKIAAAAPPAPKPAFHAMLFKPSIPSPVGSASWIAQMLAALGGALAAGALAWFLIRPTPERKFGR